MAQLDRSELSMGWVDLRVGSGWVEILQFSIGWVEYDKTIIFLMITQHTIA